MVLCVSWAICLRHQDLAGLCTNLVTTEIRASDSILPARISVIEFVNQIGTLSLI